MDPVLALTLHGLQAGMARVDQAAANLANAGTAGFRRAVVSQSPVAFAGLMAEAAAQGGTQVRLDLRAGTLKSTGQPLDIAIGGPGFLQVATPAGPAYTRAGSLRTDREGRLVTQAGHAVAGVGGDIVLGPGAVTINAAGEVSQGTGADSRVLGRLQLVAFADMASMQSLGEGLLSAGGGARLLEADEAGVRQGWLENANVSTATEMAALMQAMRQAESLQKATQAWDDMQGQAIRRLGELS